MKDAERKEIFPISDEGAPILPDRRGSIGFFRGKRARSPMILDHDQLFQNLQHIQTLQNLDMTHCSWQNYQYLSDSSNPQSNINSLSTTPTTAATTPGGLTAAATPTTSVCPQFLSHHPSRSSQPTSPVAASIQDYHPQQEQKLATFMKRNLLPPHALLTPTSISSSLSSNNNSAGSSNGNSTFSTPECCSSAVSPTFAACTQMERVQQPYPEGHSSYPHHPHSYNNNRHDSACDNQEHQGIDPVPSTHDVPALPVSDWGNRGRWSGELEWSDDIPAGLEHDGGPWDEMDSYTIEQHITRALFEGQNYSAPLDFSKETQDAGLSTIQETGHEQDVELTSSELPCSSVNSNDNDSTERIHNCDMKNSTEGSRPSMSLSTSSTTLASNGKGSERTLVILSVGCGNSQWATEMARAHPQSAVHAINVSQHPSLPQIPEKAPSFDLDNLFFYNLDDNCLRVPFVSNSVDYIHVRRFLPNVNKTKYLAFLRELVRVLKVDGYLELVELDLRLRDTGIDSCWPSYWTLIGFDKMGIDTSLALNLGGILRTMPGMEATHKSSVNMPVGIHGGRIGLAAELLFFRFAMSVRPWLMRQAMLSGAEFDDFLDRARQETRTLKSYQVCHVAVGRKTSNGSLLSGQHD
ncbi:hypothetical protein BGX28_007695 [Mortierella sp. GBA30]|nr:hypothetical protein BGX28_007695 [Mortierella sp. GBA30]